MFKVAGNVGGELSAYEKLTQVNINEREAEMERLVKVPHNQVRQEWENSDQKKFFCQFLSMNNFSKYCENKFSLIPT